MSFVRGTGAAIFGRMRSKSKSAQPLCFAVLHVCLRLTSLPPSSAVQYPLAFLSSSVLSLSLARTSSSPLSIPPSSPCTCARACTSDGGLWIKRQTEKKGIGGGQTTNSLHIGSVTALTLQATLSFDIQRDVQNSPGTSPTAFGCGSEGYEAFFL